MSEYGRRFVCDLARAFVGVGPHTAPAKYNAITEGRKSDPTKDPPFYYGWCGDFVSFILMQAGCLDGRILNRAALNNGVWTPQQNLSRLQNYASNVGAYTYFVRPGDIVINYRPDGNHIAFVEWTGASPYGWTTLNGNGKGGVVSRGGWPKQKIVGVINLDYIPLFQGKPPGYDFVAYATNAGNGKEW